MKIQSFVKRLNATELGLGATHDAYIAIPSEVNLSFMLENQKVFKPINRHAGDFMTQMDRHSSMFRQDRTIRSVSLD